MTQQIIVALIVGLAALYAVWRWMPAAWRRSAALRVATASHRNGLVDAERARRLADSLAKSGGCGDCDSCGSCAAPVTESSAANGRHGSSGSSGSTGSTGSTGSIGSSGSPGFSGSSGSPGADRSR